jgi:signal transduction histidine kinase
MVAIWQTLTDTKNRILTWTNITEQTQQQNELMQAKDREFGALQELQETQNELSEAKRLNALAKVVTNIAHELNTPIGVAITSLSGLQGNIQGIEKLIQSQQLTKAALNALISGISEYEDLANRNMHRAAGIVQQFKYISIDNYSIELQKVNLNGLISSVLATFQNELKQLNIKTSINIKMI